jgi:hypothetical protein
MTDSQIMPLIREKKGIIMLTVLLLAASAFLFLVLTEKNFKVGSEFLVVQNH